MCGRGRKGGAGIRPGGRGGAYGWVQPLHPSQGGSGGEAAGFHLPDSATSSEWRAVRGGRVAGFGLPALPPFWEVLGREIK
ncbi:hypothetical protein CEXT_251511 [Caerostris extrusa]|uniref:Uncharacterized protein n=1 Tax=Caerostris extrusa TaxID=172846 RepID=A0AAV4NDX3_CAEEX|nr:hypothetical protein CEXT_251511 [Caerostris extrusa]